MIHVRLHTDGKVQSFMVRDGIIVAASIEALHWNGRKFGQFLSEWYYNRIRGGIEYRPDDFPFWALLNRRDGIQCEYPGLIDDEETENQEEEKGK